MNPVPLQDLNACAKRFSDTVYEAADSAVMACRDKVNSGDPVAEQRSILWTNRIITVLNMFVRRPLMEMPIFPYIGVHADRYTVRRIHVVFRVFCADLPQDLDVGARREMRIELWKRTVNTLRSFFSAEEQYLVTFLNKTQQYTQDQAINAVTKGCPGSLADGIAYELLTNFEAEGILEETV